MKSFRSDNSKPKQGQSDKWMGVVRPSRRTCQQAGKYCGRQYRNKHRSFL